MEDSTKIELRLGIRIPLRDGVHLSATLYLPKGHSEPRPCAFTLTPYIADTIHERGVYSASRGLTFLSVDARGRGNSEGVFRPFIQEARDGFDVVEWLARQPWCNGKVAMCGGSYNGYNQWATAKELPPHLATIVPAAAACCAVDFPMRNNIFYPFLLQWLTWTCGHTGQSTLFADRAFWSRLFADWYDSGRPFKDIDLLLGERASVLQEWLAHPEPDSYWDAYNPTAGQYAKINVPVLTITGSYDDDQPGALEHYRAHMRNAPPAARAQHYLIIGPWDHAGTRSPQASFGGLQLGPASLLDLQALHLQWYAWTLQEGPKPAFLQKPVAYYVMGPEKWRYADTLEAITAHHAVYFLDSSGKANDIFSSGSLGLQEGRGPPDRYTYDPRRPSSPEVEAEARADGGSLTDQSLLLALSGRLLVYHTLPFQEDVEISGFFKLSVWLAIDCPDTDIYVSVHEIRADGSSIRLSTDGMRARYRQGLRNPQLIQNDEPLRYDFERFTFVSREVKRGHRLRLVIAPMGRLVESTFTQKNYNGGGEVAQESREQGRAVTVRLLHDSTHPSRLEVPLGRREESPS